MITRGERPAAESGRADEAFKQSLADFERQLDRRFETKPLSRPDPVGEAVANRSTWNVWPTVSRFPVVMVSTAVAAAGVSILVMQLVKSVPVPTAPSPTKAVAVRTPSAADIVPPAPPPAAPVVIESSATATPQQAAKSDTPPAPLPPPRDRGRLNATEVREIQARLAILGFNPGPADGAAGPQTSAAVRRFEEATGRPPTGSVDRETWTQLRNEPALQQAGR